MKWRNKGHELDSYADRIVTAFKSKGEKIYIFGAGILGENNVSAFERYECFGGYIDNDENKQKKGMNGRKVFSFDQYIANGSEGFIVIAADKKNIPSMEAQLNEAGKERGIDYWIYKEFMHDVFPVLSFYRYGLLYVDLAQICLTERCTLKCKDCAHGCFAVDAKSQDIGLETAKQSADMFFDKVDAVREFVLIGGEPFLYNNMEKIITYIGEKYRNKMITFSITTNGTIMPRQEVLELCQKYDILIRISNYSATIGWLEEKYLKLTDKLKEFHIAYILSERDAVWMDYGFDKVNRGGRADELEGVFNACKTPCREIRGNKYYYCVMARSVSENLGFHVGEEDYLDMKKLDKDAKKVLLEFEYGYSEKGYLDMCNYCRGADAVNYPIPVAEQVNIWANNQNK